MSNPDDTGTQEGITIASKPRNSKTILNEVEKLFSSPEPTELQIAKTLLITKRLGELTASSKPTEISTINSKTYRGFIHPESKIIRNFMVDPFCLNDDEIYKVFLETIGEFYRVPAWKELGPMQVSLNAINRAIGKYFGNYYGTQKTEDRNQRFNLDHNSSDSININLSELKGKNLAVCAEKATVAQNLLTFIGIESTLIFSSNCILSEGKPATGHAYVVFKTENGFFIYDPTNPIIATGDEERVSSVYPAIYAINEQEYELLMSGGEVVVSHSNLKTVGKQLIKDEPQKRIYAG